MKTPRRYDNGLHEILRLSPPRLLMHAFGVLSEFDVDLGIHFFLYRPVVLQKSHDLLGDSSAIAKNCYIFVSDAFARLL